MAKISEGERRYFMEVLPNADPNVPISIDKVEEVPEDVKLGVLNRHFIDASLGGVKQIGYFYEGWFNFGGQIFHLCWRDAQDVE